MLAEWLCHYTGIECPFSWIKDQVFAFNLHQVLPLCVLCVQSVIFTCHCKIICNWQENIVCMTFQTTKICSLYLIYIHPTYLYIYMFTIIKEQLIANIYGTHVCNPLLAPLKGCPGPPWTLPWNLKIWKNFSLAFPNSSRKLFPAVLVPCSCLKEG